MAGQNLENRVFDCFPLFNEVDLLELRLNELWDIVDVFVIVEARQTFTGNPKPLCLIDERERFEKYMKKVRYVVVDAFPEGTSNWGKEEYQRNYMQSELSDALPEDIIVFSDLDEIPRARVVRSIAEHGIEPGQIYCLSLDFHCFFLNVKLRSKWERQGPRMIRAADLKDLYSLRRVLAPGKGTGRDLIRQIKASRNMGRWVRRILVHDAGWHFTWMGGTEAVRLKGSSIPEHSHLPEGEKTEDWADNRIKTLFESNTSYDIVDLDENFPAFVLDHPEIFKKYTLLEKEIEFAATGRSSSETL